MRRLLFALVTALSLGVAGCPPDEDDADTTGDAGDVAADASALKWYATCGDPVCSTHKPKPGVTACTDQVAGQSCATAGSTCDPVNDCNSLLMCTDTDPTMQTGGCPISRRALKRDIEPLSELQRDALYDALRRMPLTTWRYLSDSAERPPRLGFIIEEVGPSPAVDDARGIVDLYGFTTMTAASLQAQADQIDALQREVEALKRELRSRPTP
jgi:hypothetical protein